MTDQMPFASPSVAALISMDLTQDIQDGIKAVVIFAVSPTPEAGELARLYSVELVDGKLLRLRCNRCLRLTTLSPAPVNGHAHEAHSPMMLARSGARSRSWSSDEILVLFRRF